MSRSCSLVRDQGQYLLGKVKFLKGDVSMRLVIVSAVAYLRLAFSQVLLIISCVFFVLAFVFIIRINVDNQVFKS